MKNEIFSKIRVYYKYKRNRVKQERRIFKMNLFLLYLLVIILIAVTSEHLFENKYNELFSYIAIGFIFLLSYICF